MKETLGILSAAWAAIYDLRKWYDIRAGCGEMWLTESGIQFSRDRIRGINQCVIMPGWHSQVITTSKGFDLSNLKKRLPKHVRGDSEKDFRRPKNVHFGKKHPWQLSCNRVVCSSWRFSSQIWHLGLHHLQSFFQCFSCTNQGSANSHGVFEKW